jgi:hypothetical protein
MKVYVRRYACLNAIQKPEPSYPFSICPEPTQSKADYGHS